MKPELLEILFERLPIRSLENISCPVCQEDAPSGMVVENSCGHGLCNRCFHACVSCLVLPNPIFKEPQFPIPALEATFWTSPNDPKWKKYPDIAAWLETYEYWEAYEDGYHEALREQVPHLGKCPLCRAIWAE
jgi:hypothetical protein